MTSAGDDETSPLGLEGAQDEETRPVGQGTHRVRDGECLQSIALAYGLDWKTLRDHADNAELKEARGDGRSLLPGDRVTIPEKTLGEETVATESAHRFRRKGVPAKLRVRFLEDGEPRARAPCLVTIDGATSEHQTDGGGWLEVVIPPDASEGSVRVGRGEEEIVYRLRLGSLAPLTSRRGVAQRLANLGLYEGDPGDEDLPGLEDAVARFQAREGLDGSGEVDDATRDRLAQAHGD